MSALRDALRRRLGADRSRLHMPGHKGILPPPLDAAAPWDMTELPDTDSLYEAQGCLARLEETFAGLYGARRTLLSAGGATLCVQAMLALAGPGATVVCDRNLHASALAAMALLGQTPVWVCGAPGPEGLPRPPRAAAVREALRAHPEAAAVYVTSPNYYGFPAGIGALAAEAHGRGAALLVDNAHGAHLRFLPGGLHPLAQGADACCDSLHKMLPALTGAALLHFGEGGRLDAGQAKARMAWFGSTSPSYLILLSMDLLADALAGPLPETLLEAAGRAESLRARLYGGEPEKPFDPLRLTIPLAGRPEAGLGTPPLDSAGMRRLLYECGVEPELCDPLAAVLLCGAATSGRDWERLEELARRLPPRPAGAAQPLSPAPKPPRAAMGLREAMLGPRETVPLEAAAGRIAAEAVSHCPPGVPLVVPGERIGADTTFLLQSYGFTALDVVK